ncbi:MAG: cation:proton antiporter [Nitrososphaerota archaeon]
MNVEIIYTTSIAKAMPYPILFDVLIILGAATVLGEVFEQFGLPHVIGELLAGIVIGPTVLKLLMPSPELTALSSIAVFFIIFLIGLEMNTEMLRRNIARSTIISLTSFIIPVIPLFFISYFLFPFGLTADFILVLAICVPSISIVSVMVMRLQLVQKITGQIILSSVIVSDIIAFVLLALFTQSFMGILYTVLYLVIFAVVFILIDRLINYRVRAFRRLLEYSSGFLKREGTPYAILIIIGLIVSIATQYIGISYILGAFFTGLIVHEGIVGKESYTNITRTFEVMNRSFFIPIFFGISGLQAELRLYNFYTLSIFAIIVAADIIISFSLSYIASKRMLGMTDGSSAKIISSILGGRGAVGIIIATLAFGLNLINQTAYSLILLGTMIISFVTPLAIRSRG